MEGDKISSRQLMTLLWVALLAPALETMPTLGVAAAGRASWLAPLVLAPLVFVMGILLYKVGGLEKGLTEAFGHVLGRGLLLLYIMWGVLLLALRLRLTAQRLMGGGDRDGSLWFLLPALALLTLWMAWGKRQAYARTVEVFFGIIATTIIIVVGLSALQIEWGNLFPIWWGDAPALGLATIPAAGSLGYGIYAALFLGEVAWTPACRRHWGWWCLLGCGGLALILLVILGNFGPVLTGRLSSPFFALAKSVGVEGAFQRVESLVSALWTLCDLAVMGLLLRGASLGVKKIWPQWRERFVAPALLIPAVVLGLVAIPDGYTAHRLGETVAIWGNLAMGWGIPIIIGMAVWAKRRG